MSSEATLHARLTRRFLHSMTRTPEGRAHVLRQCAEAESSGEGQIFERALAHVDDPELTRLIKRHQADEIRHATMFNERLAATGIDLEPVPPELRIIDRLDAILGGFFGKPISDRRGVMEAYVLLQVIEERAATQFTLMEGAFRAAGDLATADTFAEIARDEARHLLYCQAISRRYAASTDELETALARFRDAETRAFGDNSRANLAHVLERGYIDAGPVEKFLWRALLLLAPVLDSNPSTPYADQARARQPRLATAS